MTGMILRTGKFQRLCVFVTERNGRGFLFLFVCNDGETGLAYLTGQPHYPRHAPDDPADDQQRHARSDPLVKDPAALAAITVAKGVDGKSQACRSPAPSNTVEAATAPDQTAASITGTSRV